MVVSSVTLFPHFGEFESFYFNGDYLLSNLLLSSLSIIPSFWRVQVFLFQWRLSIIKAIIKFSIYYSLLLESSRVSISMENVIPQHRLSVFARTAVGSSSTKVLISVQDVNEFAPNFASGQYQTQITEEDDRHLPKVVLQVINE